METWASASNDAARISIARFFVVYIDQIFNFHTMCDGAFLLKPPTFQAVVNQANKQHISLIDGSAPRQWKELALQIADSVVKSAKAAKFDFQTLQLRFPANGRTLLITKINGVLEAK